MGDLALAEPLGGTVEIGGGGWMQAEPNVSCNISKSTEQKIKKVQKAEHINRLPKSEGAREMASLSERGRKIMPATLQVW